MFISRVQLPVCAVYFYLPVVAQVCSHIDEYLGYTREMHSICCAMVSICSHIPRRCA